MLTGRPELAVALTVNGASPKVLLASGPNVIVWLSLSIAKVFEAVSASWAASP